jgi:hypothetical protein
LLLWGAAASRAAGGANPTGGGAAGGHGGLAELVLGLGVTSAADELTAAEEDELLRQRLAEVVIRLQFTKPAGK